MATSVSEKASEKYATTDMMYARAEDVPPRPSFPTDNPSEVTIAGTSSESEKVKPLATDNTYICMMYTKASDVPPRPPFPTAATVIGKQETGTLATVPKLTLGSSDSHVGTRLSFHRPSLWPNGSRIRVRFGNGTPTLWARVQAYVAWWTAYANITFEFVDSGPSEVRVTFNTNDGSWALMGTQNLQRAQDQPTMNLNIDENMPPERVRAEILHEFGHVLGAIHEHLSPLARIPWNEAAVYDHHRQLGNSQEWVDHNILRLPYPESEVDADADDRSIMVYPYPASFTTNGTSVGWMTDLSTRDYQRIAMVYPRNQYAVSSVATNQPLEEPMEWQSITLGISPQQSSPPQFASALSYIDMSNRDDDLRVRAQVTDVQTDRFTVGVGSWGDRIFYNGGVSLLRVPAGDANFRMGTITNAGPNSYRIQFRPPFPPGTIPNVFAAFSGIDSGDNWRGALDIHNANAAQFDIQVSAWGSSVLYSANVQWIAYPNNLPGVELGTFTGAGSSSGRYQLRNTFYNTPMVFTGFQRFDISANQNARLRVRATAADPTRVDWAIETWSDSVVYSIVGVFLAISSGG
ncbi:Metalloprotease [Xylaria bambusicola]|uniref:Metalloprotease n=1 Tax=Xylaria bambusicola TaxID=326684 RepID=UPI00200823D5|nr:Metalloprotease [Xylaria bambusicola]KAI0523754.1 Metalloprotease [Xylaria bambusicola]